MLDRSSTTTAAEAIRRMAAQEGGRFRGEFVSPDRFADLTDESIAHDAGGLRAVSEPLHMSQGQGSAPASPELSNG